eukprot:CAMPEP_0194478374 /NCGR_PEP_ID=MMETSP0253-20130528/1837_1 /TAXON_ID=2966 /ORGANISM="Noctiluca scintillans" /LENGTH=246 /DNA_ID=CAMNT_0039317455 /DNA_START=190 /DNA_END=932 /DNA_ORIENTATION=+
MTNTLKPLNLELPSGALTGRRIRHHWHVVLATPRHPVPALFGGEHAQATPPPAPALWAIKVWNESCILFGDSPTSVVSAALMAHPSLRTKGSRTRLVTPHWMRDNLHPAALLALVVKPEAGTESTFVTHAAQDNSFHLTTHAAVALRMGHLDHTNSVHGDILSAAGAPSHASCLFTNDFDASLQQPPAEPSRPQHGIRMCGSFCWHTKQTEDDTTSVWARSLATGLRSASDTMATSSARRDRAFGI